MPPFPFSRPSIFKPTNYFRGMVAEIYAIIYLSIKGYRILAWRYKTPVGEVDIIARRGRVLAFVEVKLRPDTDAALYAITPRSQQRIARAANHFMASREKAMGEKAHFPRFDAVAVCGWRVKHLDNAWQSIT